MRHGSLFSGIGGFDLAAEWMGWENVFHCEWNPFGQKILKHYWPNAKSYGDITKTDFTEWRGKVDIVSGGFPCQPFSTAGKRKGKEDNRFLWPEMLRAIKEIRPTWVVAENVHGIINQGRGMVFEQVQAEMENEGYQVQSYLLPACAVNAPHRRDRFWFVGYPAVNRWERERKEVTNENREARPKETRELAGGFKRLRGPWTITNSASIGCKGRKQTKNSRNIKRESRRSNRINSGFGWEKFPQVESTVCSRDDGLSSELDGITISKHRKESLMAYGNAIVPQVAYEIFKAIEEFELINQGTGT